MISGWNMGRLINRNLATSTPQCGSSVKKPTEKLCFLSSATKSATNTLLRVLVTTSGFTCSKNDQQFNHSLGAFKIVIFAEVFSFGA